MDYIASLQFIHIGCEIQLNGEKMDTNAKIIVVAIVALLVGVGVGYGVSAVMSDTSDDEEYSFISILKQTMKETDGIALRPLMQQLPLTRL